MDPDRSAGWRSVPQPEILPPGDYPGAAPPQQPRGWYPPPPPPPRAPRRHWASAPATYFLVGINCCVFLLMLVSGHSLWGPSFQDPLSNLSVCNGGLVLDGQWWRIVTSIFVHFDWIHLLTNMWCLWNLGLLGEPLLGELGMIAAYLLTGVAGNLLSIAVHPQLPSEAGAVVSAGASGAVFGLAGVLLVLLRSPLLPIPEVELKKLRRSVWYFALINFVIGAGVWFAHTRLQIDNMAHLGGFLSGFAFGIPLVPRIGAPRSTFVRRRSFAVLAMTFVLLLIAWGIRAYYGPVAG